MYNIKSITVPLGDSIFHTRIKYDNTTLEYKYQIKYEQSCVFESVTSSCVAIGNSFKEENHVVKVCGCGRKQSQIQLLFDICG